MTFDEPWQEHEALLQKQVEATHAMLAVLALTRRLGQTAESAIEAGWIQQASPQARAWFDPVKFMIGVVFTRTSDIPGAKEALVTLVENGYHGLIGPFEIKEAKVVISHVEIYLLKHLEGRETITATVNW